MKTYEQGETVTIEATIKTRAETLSNPSSVTIYIKDPAGSELVAGSDMTNEGTGTYYYPYDIESDATEGVWEYRVVATSTNTAYERGNFKVKTKY